MALFTSILAAFEFALSVEGFASTVVGGFIIKELGSVAVSALVKLIMGNQSQPAIGVSGKLQAGEGVPRQFPPGIGMTAGSLAYANDWGAAGKTPNAYHTDVIALSDLPVKGLLAVMVNGVFVTLDPTLTSMGYAVLEYRDTVHGVDYLWIKFYDGTQTAADTFLTGTVASLARPWGSTRVGYGVAYAICTARFAPSLFTGFPTYRFMLDSVPLYDVSKDTTAGGSGTQRWATPSTWGGDGDYLPAVQAYNVLRGISYAGAWVFGFQGMGAGRLPNADWIAAIGVCRATVTGASGAEPRYRAGGILAVNATNGDALDQIMAACAGRIGETGGIYKPLVGAVGSTVATFTDADIITTEDQSLTMFQGLADTVNSITAQYPEPNAGFAMTASPPLINTALETADGGRRLPAALTLANVPYAEQAQRLMKIALNEARRAVRHTITLPPSFWAVEANDTVAYTSTRHGYTSKLFRVDAVLDRIDAHVTVDITELQATDYDFTTGTDYHPQTARAAVSSPQASVAVPGFAVNPYVINGGTGNQSPGLELLWDATQIEDIDAVRWEGRIPSVSTTVVFTGQMVNPEDGRAVVSVSLPNTGYEVRAKLVGKRKTTWGTWLAATSPNVSSHPVTGTITAADVIQSGGGTAQDYSGLTDRPSFVTWAVGKTPPVGTVIFIAGDGYRWKGSGTAIADVPGWVPFIAINAGNWGIYRSTTADVTTKLQAMIDYAETLAIGIKDRVEIHGTGAPMTTTAPLKNTLASIAYMDWQLVAGSGSWGTVTYATTTIFGDEHPVATAMMMIGGRYAATPSFNSFAPVFGPGFRIDCNRYAMGGLALSGIDTPTGDVYIASALVYHVYLGKIAFCKWAGTIYIDGASTNSDDNVPAFRTGRGLWNVTGDNFIGQIHVSLCRENIYTTSSPLFVGFVHTFGGWKGNGPNWTAFTAGTTTITVDGSGVVLTAPITSAGLGYAVGDALFVEKYAGDMALAYGSNRHQDPDNWPGLCCLVVTSVNGSGGITGLRVASDRHGTNAWGTGYSAGVKTLYHIQKISPRGPNLVQYGGLTVDTLYLDKCIAYMYGSYKLRVKTAHVVADDELAIANLLTFKAQTGGRDVLVNCEILDVHFNITNTYGTYNPRNMIYVDETETPFTQCAAHIVIALPNQQAQDFRAFPTTIGRTERYFGAENVSGSAGAYYVDWDLGDAGFAGELYRLPAAKALRFSSLKDATKTFQYRYLADNPLVAPATTDVTVRRHTVRVYLDDNTRDGGDVVRAEWNGIVRAENAGATAFATGPAYIHLPDPAHGAPDFSALWSGANAGVLGEWWSSRSGLFQDAGATSPCTADGQALAAGVGKRGLLTAVAAAGEEMVYKIDANGIPYIQGLGTLKRLITGNYNMSSVGVVTIFAAIINRSDAASATFFNNNGALDKSWRLTCPSNTSFAHGVTANGLTGSTLSLTDTLVAKPLRSVIVATVDLPGTTLTYQINGRDKKTTTGALGSATVWDNKPIAIGARTTGTSTAVTGDIYELGFFGKIFTAAEVLLARKLLASAVGVVLNA